MNLKLNKTMEKTFIQFIDDFVKEIKSIERKQEARNILKTAHLRAIEKGLCEQELFLFFLGYTKLISEEAQDFMIREYSQMIKTFYNIK